MNWEERDQHEDRCSYPNCRLDWGIKYSRGATELNREHDLYFCDAHLGAWYEELTGLNTDTQPADFASALALRKGL